MKQYYFNTKNNTFGVLLKPKIRSAVKFNIAEVLK